MTRTIELSDFADDIVLQLVALPLDKDICISLHDSEKGGIGAVVLARPRDLPDGKRECDVYSVSAGTELEESIARAVAEKVAAETGGCVSMSCGALPVELTEDGRREVMDISMNLARNLVSKLKMKQERLLENSDNRMKQPIRVAMVSCDGHSV